MMVIALISVATKECIAAHQGLRRPPSKKPEVVSSRRPNQKPKAKRAATHRPTRRKSGQVSAEPPKEEIPSTRRVLCDMPLEGAIFGYNLPMMADLRLMTALVCLASAL